MRHYCRSSHKLAENGKRNWGRSFALTFQMKLILLKYYHEATIPLCKQNIFCLISCQNIFFIFLFTICNIWSYLAKSPASTVNETRCFGASCRKFFLCLNIYRAPNPGEPPTPIPSPLTQILTLPHTHTLLFTPSFPVSNIFLDNVDNATLRITNGPPSHRRQCLLYSSLPLLFLCVFCCLHLFASSACFFVCYYVCFFVHLVVMFPDTNGLPLPLAMGHQQRHCVLFALSPIYGDCLIILIKICIFISWKYVL